MIISFKNAYIYSILYRMNVEIENAKKLGKEIIYRFIKR